MIEEGLISKKYITWLLRDNIQMFKRVKIFGDAGQKQIVMPNIFYYFWKCLRLTFKNNTNFSNWVYF